MRLHALASLLAAAALLATPLTLAPPALAADAAPSSGAPPVLPAGDEDGASPHPSGAGAEAPADLNAPVLSSHKPGRPGYGDLLPADLTVPANSPAAAPGALADAAGRVPHVCAGRKSLHHSHVDAAYATRLDGELAMTVVDGQSVVTDPSSVCIRLAPDARSSDGTEVSRFIIPSTPAGLFDFLGRPGEIVWNAPQERIDDWRPVWAGVGAFDVGHETALPDGLLLDEVELKIVEAAGPGRVEVWRTVGSDSLSRGLSSDATLAPLTLKTGSHGHWNWSFTKPGVYRLTMTAAYTLAATGERVVSAPSTITWLVGSDEEVGLPAGTTSSLTPIRTSAERLRDALLASGALSADAGAPDTPAGEFGVAQARAQVLALFRNVRFVPAPPSAPQEYVYAPTMVDEERDGQPMTSVSLTVTAGGSPITGSPILEIPDSLKQTSAEGERWVLPAAGPHGSLGYDFTGMPAELRSQPIVYAIDLFSGPEGGRYIAGTVEDGRMMVRHDTVNKASRKGHTSDSTAMPLAHVFTKPGVYKVSFNISTDDAGKRHSYASRVAYFVVGDAAIRALHEIDAEKRAASESGSSAGTGGSSDSNGSTGPSDSGTSGGSATAEPAPAEAESPGSDSESTEPLELITEGHMDQAFRFDAGRASAVLIDTADPRTPRIRESGTFAYAVPDLAHHTIPAGARGYAELAAAAPKGVWTLPETQLEGLPWLGFSTEKVDYAALGPRGVEVAIRGFTGPGRLVTGTSSLLDGFVTRLDSTKTGLALSYPRRSHDHQAFHFTAPGRYSVDFLYTAHLADGSTLERTLRAFFLVGDAEIASARSSANPSGAEHTEDSTSSSSPGTASGASTKPGGAEGSGVKRQTIDELVSSLNATSRAHSDAASTAGASSGSSSPIALPQASHPLLAATAGPNSVPSGTSGAGGASPAGGSIGTDQVSGTLVSSNAGAGASVEAASSGVEGLDFTEGVQSGSSGAATRALARPGATSALLNPHRGSASFGESGSWWQWILVGAGASALLGVGGWILRGRLRA